jgi:hypothetical protein
MSNDDYTPNQKSDMLEEVMKARASTKLILANFHALTPCSADRTYAGLCAYLEEQEENMDADLTRDQVGYSAMTSDNQSKLYTQQDMDSLYGHQWRRQAIIQSRQGLIWALEVCSPPGRGRTRPRRHLLAAWKNRSSKLEVHGTQTGGMRRQSQVGHRDP